MLSDLDYSKLSYYICTIKFNSCYKETSNYIDNSALKTDKTHSAHVNVRRQTGIQTRKTVNVLGQTEIQTREYVNVLGQTEVSLCKNVNVLRQTEVSLCQYVKNTRRID